MAVINKAERQKKKKKERKKERKELLDECK